MMIMSLATKTEGLSCTRIRLRNRKEVQKFPGIPKDGLCHMLSTRLENVLRDSEVFRLKRCGGEYYYLPALTCMCTYSYRITVSVYNNTNTLPAHTKASGVGGRVSKLRDIILGRRVNTSVEGAGYLRLHALNLDIYQHVVK